MTELCATGTANARRLPEVFYAVWRRLDDFDWLGAAERTAAVFKDLNLHDFAGQNVRNEQHAPLVSGNKDATVRDLLNGRFEFAA